MFPPRIRRPERLCACGSSTSWKSGSARPSAGQAESLEQIASDVRLVACLVDRAYAGLLDTIAFRDVSDVDARMAKLSKYHGIWRKAAGRLWRGGGLVFHLAANAEDLGGEEK